MPRGGKRTPSAGKTIGRPKTTRPVDGNVARKIKAKVRAEELWVQCVAIAYKKARETGNSSDLRACLEYLDDRDLGRCTDNVNHIHKDPIEMNATLTLGEGMRLAMEKAEQRVRSRK
jgi:hypothetical protein